MDKSSYVEESAGPVAEVAPPLEIRLSVMEGGLRLAGQLWVPVSGSLEDVGKPIKEGEYCKRIITYPGWLDNAGSFTNLAQLLVRQGYFVLCLDPPGTGQSDHRAQESTYSDYNESPLIVMAADQMGWDKFILMTHSRGSGIGALVAGAFPKRVVAFISFDSSFGVIGTWFRDIEGLSPTAPQRMHLAYKQVKKNKNRKMRVFKTLEEAIDANANNPTFIKSRETAKNIVLRHIRPCEGGFTFTHDIRTYGTQEFASTHEDTLREFLKNIQCPVLSIVMKDGLMSQNPPGGRNTKFFKVHEERFRLIKDSTIHELPGGHHLHSDEAEACMKLVLPFLNQPKLRQNAEAKNEKSGAAKKNEKITPLTTTASRL